MTTSRAGTAVALLLSIVATGVLWVTPGSRVAAATATATHSQIITVRAQNSTTTYATVEAWQRTSSGAYRRVGGPWIGRVGARGIGATRANLARTPAGRFPLGPTFGLKSNPGTTMPHFKVDRNDVWGGDPAHRSSYNRHVRCAPYTCPFRISGYSERLINYPGVYDYAAFIRYNADPPVIGKGAAFFLHVTDGQPTAGCVAVSRVVMVWLLKWMKPWANPLISIGVGWRAYAPIPRRHT